jgi:hypothetical protein
MRGLLDMGHQLHVRSGSNCQLHGTANVIKFGKTVNSIAHFELSKGRLSKETSKKRGADDANTGSHCHALIGELLIGSGPRDARLLLKGRGLTEEI